MLVVWSDKGCQFKFLVRLGRGDHATVFCMLAVCGAWCWSLRKRFPLSGRKLAMLQ